MEVRIDESKYDIAFLLDHAFKHNYLIIGFQRDFSTVVDLQFLDYLGIP